MLEKIRGYVASSDLLTVALIVNLRCRLRRLFGFCSYINHRRIMMPKFLVYSVSVPSLPKRVIEASSAMAALDEFINRLKWFEYVGYCNVIPSIDETPLDDDCYAAKLNKWREDHKDIKWTGTLPTEKPEMNEDQLRDWFECYRMRMENYPFPVPPLSAIREFKRIVELNK